MTLESRKTTYEENAANCHYLTNNLGKFDAPSYSC